MYFGMNFIQVHGGGINQLFLFPELSKFFTRWGFVCNHVFAGITGYGLASKLSQKESISDVWRVYYEREVSLISTAVPLYIIASIVFIVTCGGVSKYLGIYKNHSIVANIILDMFGCADIFKLNMMNPTWWYFGVSYFFVTALCTLILGLRYIKIDKKLAYIVAYCALVAMLFIKPFLYGNVTLSCLTGVLIYKFDIVTRISKTFENRKNVVVGRTVEMVCILIAFLLWYFLARHLDTHFVSAIILPPVFMLVVTDYIQHIPVAKNVLAFIGKYSAYVFMIHTFIYNIFTYSSDFVYSFKYAIVTYLLVLGISLCTGIFIDCVEVKLGYKCIIEKLKEIKHAKVLQ